MLEGLTPRTWISIGDEISGRGRLGRDLVGFGDGDRKGGEDGFRSCTLQPATFQSQAQTDPSQAWMIAVYFSLSFEHGVIWMHVMFLGRGNEMESHSILHFDFRHCIRTMI